MDDHAVLARPPITRLLRLDVADFRPFVMVCRMRTDRERQSMAINNRHDFHAFSALRGSDLRSATFRHNERCVDEAFCFIERAAVAKFVGNIRQDPAQNFVAAPSLKSPMHSFVVRIALRQHVPLRTGVENPQHRFKDATCGNRFAILGIICRARSREPRFSNREPSYAAVVAASALRVAGSFGKCPDTASMQRLRASLSDDT
jgi:hypothetical protein